MTGDLAGEYVYLVRHGRPASGWGSADPDPGLDDAGRAQAVLAAERMMALPSDKRPTRVVSSPLRRCRETARPLAEALGVEIEIRSEVGEVPTPAGLQPEERPPWLQQALARDWGEIIGDLDYDEWRRAVTDAVADCAGSAVFSHFVAINAVVSVLSRESRVIVFRPDHTSITTLSVAERGLRLVSRGSEAITGVL